MGRLESQNYRDGKRIIIISRLQLNRFIPGFHVLTDTLELSNGAPSADLEISGTNGVLGTVKVDVDREDFLYVGRDRSESIR